MARENYGQYSFNAGEWSAYLLGRQDLQNYKNAAFIVLNFLPMVQGGLTRRPGSLFLTTTKFGGDKESRLLRFEFGVEQTYQLEFGDQYIRFFTNNGILTEATDAISGITAANPPVVTIGSTDAYSNDDRVFIANTGGMGQLESREVVVKNMTATTFECYDIYGNAIDGSSFDAYSGGAGTVAKILEITTPYLEADLPEIRVTQSADTLYIFHPDHAVRKLVRETATTWTLTEIEFFDGPYGDVNTTDTTLTPGATTGSSTFLLASATTGINDDEGFKATDVGRLVRLQHGGNWGYAEIIGFTNSQNVTIDILEDFNDTASVKEWRLGLYSDTTGYPAAGTFYEDRLFLGGAELSPQRIDGSRSGRYENFRPTDVDGTVANDHAVGYTLASSDVNKVRWMQGNEKGLLVGTAGGEWILRPSLLSEALTPTNVSAKNMTTYGSDPVDSVRVGDVVMYAQLSGRKIRELRYEFDRDGFRSPDMTVLAEHITIPRVTELVYQQNPQSVLWAVRSDGVLLSFTYDADHGVIAWARHELGGGGEVESVAVTPSADTTRDEVYLIVKRTINGRAERYVEVLTDLWETLDEQTLAFYVDSGLTFVEPGGVSTIEGLWHLEGETVTVFADGAAHPDRTVSNGKISLKRTSFIVSVGEGYQSDVEFLPIEAGSQEGTAQGLMKKIHRISFWLLDTLGMKYGPSDSNLTELLTRTWGYTYGDAEPLFTGIARLRFEGDHDRLGQVYVRADKAFPCNLLAAHSQVITEEDS